MNAKITYAIAAILAGASFGASAADQAADAGPSADSGGLEEIVVTAQRRSENMQDVPIAMQAFTAETLQQLNVQTLDDYLKFLPNVTTANNGPGQNEIFMRGLSAGSQPSQGSGSTGLWPNVAIYLDNQSGQLPNRNLDIYAADLNRIEVLEGPQGTLFGSGAEAGVIRYITNEPKLDVTEGNVNASYGVTSHGDPNQALTAVLNVPLIDNTLAVRGVFYDDRRGGYINNVPATFTRSSSDIGIHYANYPNGCTDGGAGGAPVCEVPPGSVSINNAGETGSAINPVTYQGVRGELLYKINDDWDVLISQTFQDMDAEGVFYQQPYSSDGAPLQPLEVTLFNPSYDKDNFESTAWTVNGKFGDLKAVYTGGYLTRHVDQVGDYTNYSRGVYADYYQCYTGTCFSPRASWHSSEQNEHQQHEFRVSTPDDWRLRGIVGAFWEDDKLYDQTGWEYKSIPNCTATLTSNCMTDVGTVPGSSVQGGGIQSDNTSFYQNTMRETKQTAFFASMDFDLIPKVLTATFGTRHFLFQNSSVGSVSGSFGCFDAGAPPCLNDSYNLNAEHLRDTESGFKSRANLTWHVIKDVMVYYTFSQGFRPGGFNQNGGAEHAYGPDAVYQYSIPSSYHSDELTNNEIGWKTEFLDHRIQWNGAVYRENWDNVQVAFFDPGLVGNIFFNANGQNFLIKGLETSIIARVTDGLTLQASSSWNQSKQTNSPALIDNVLGSVNYGKPITEQCSSSGTDCGAITNPYGPIGSPSANSPPLQYALRARYELNWNGYIPFIQADATHKGPSFTQAGSNPTIAEAGGISTGRLRFEDPSYTTYDASIGIAKDKWNVSLFGENLADSNASTFISTDQFIVAQTPLRPRIVGLTFGYKF